MDDVEMGMGHTPGVMKRLLRLQPLLDPIFVPFLSED